MDLLSLLFSHIHETHKKPAQVERPKDESGQPMTCDALVKKNHETVRSYKEDATKAINKVADLLEDEESDLDIGVALFHDDEDEL